LKNGRWSFVFWIITAVLAGSLLRAQSANHEQYASPWRTAWTYEQAAHWSDLDPEYALCNTGKEQSPIDIRNTQKADLPPLTFEFKNAPLRYVVNNRYTIRVNYRSGNGDFLLVGNKRYELTQFHFHHPSEEHIDGKAYPMEVHLMYKADDGSVAGVTVFVQPGRSNATALRIWEHMPKNEGQEQVRGADISPAHLLPAERISSYYMYLGSVTAPPCTEGVTWLVLKQPIEMSTEQIDAFAALFPMDARPIQPVNSRVVKETE
jgi:carbonic anhydrase